MENICLVDAVFEAKRAILSLPPWHGARFSAWMRLACARLNVSLPQIALGILPFRAGSRPIDKGEFVVLRLIMEQRQTSVLPNLAAALASVRDSGEFSASTLRLACWRDGVKGAMAGPNDEKRLRSFAPLDRAALRPEIDALGALPTWTLEFFAPLRLRNPLVKRNSGDDMAKYCQPDFFAAKNSLAWLLSRIRHIEAEPAETDNLEISAVSLNWRDLRYGPSRHIALGGLTGALAIRGAPCENTAFRLAIGQYLGAGKNPLFGLGHWRIRELAPGRKIIMPR